MLTVVVVFLTTESAEESWGAVMKWLRLHLSIENLRVKQHYPAKITEKIACRFEAGAKQLVICTFPSLINGLLMDFSLFFFKFFST